MLRTKIVCTLGPASSSPEVIRGLLEGGMNVARVNMSHGDSDTHRKMVDRLRSIARELGRPVGVLADLQGPKIRVGRLEEPRNLVENTIVVVAPESEATGDQIPTTYEDMAGDLSEGDRVILDDGALELECEAVEGRRIRFRVVRGGILTSNKGINLPGVEVHAPSLTEKDLKDLEFALGVGVEFVGLSFVRNGEDVIDLKEHVAGRALVVAKIEMARALHAIEDILAVTDAVMVARGDLGVELPFEKVPLAQKRIIELANHYGRPVITATQMLDSMMENARPTRAEASDVANAILDGTDAVMLSGETAVGAYPLESLDALVRIAAEIEASGVLEKGPLYISPSYARQRLGATAREHAVASATVDAVRRLDAPAVIVITRGGFSARLVSSYRPPVPIFAVCTDMHTVRQLSAVWGVRALFAESEEVSYESLTAFGLQAVRDSGEGAAGESVVVTAGFPFHTSGSTNTMRVEEL